MISVEEARERILSFVPLLGAVETPILEASGQMTAQNVVSDLNIPPLDNTAMDGYAVRASDTAAATETAPVMLRVAGELAAGYVFDGEVMPGTAVRIMTGAPVPRGADAIVPFEETDEPAGREFGSFAKPRERVGVRKAAAPGANVRKAAEDVRRGQTIIAKGALIGPAQIAVLASLGKATVNVHRRPIVAILSTGDEVKEPGQPLAPGQIYDSNAYGIAAMVAASGGVPKRLGVAMDTVEALTAKIHDGLGADMLVTSAGVSRGDYDIVKDVLAREGEINFWTVRMRPGKPLAFGAFNSGGRRVPHIGLPGNPVSAMVSFELFGRAAIYKMLGRRDWERPGVRVIADEPIENDDERRVYARAIVTKRDGRYHAALTGPQGSGVLTSMARANALVIVPENVWLVRPGEEVDAILLD